VLSGCNLFVSGGGIFGYPGSSTREAFTLQALHVIAAPGGKDIRLDPVILKDANIKALLEYFMGKNTPARQMHIVNNLRVEKDDESINPLVAKEVDSVTLPVAV